MKKASCEQKTKIEVDYPGNCDCGGICPAEEAPVCGSNKKTTTTNANSILRVARGREEENQPFQSCLSQNAPRSAAAR